jgi:ribonuclease VapC
MMTDESDAAELAARLERARNPITSPIALFETAAAVARVLALDPREALEAVGRFLTLMKIETMPVPSEVVALAVEAFARYGKGRGHPAQLNLGDCFAYACARHFDRPLLYKGDDFARTDIEPG